METPVKRAGRDLRVDFFRGVALLVIFWDHVVNMTQPESLLFRLTPKYWGFSDAAEMFVFFSGLVFGMVYGRVLATEGYGACQRKALSRVGVIYAANSIALVATALIVAVFHYGLGTGQNYFEDFFAAPGEMALRAAVLNYLPWNFGILPLYMVILAGMAPMLVLLRRNVVAGLALSFAIYGCTHLFPEFNMLRYHGVDGRWSFNPFAWQLLFTVAAAFGMGALDASRIPRNRFLLAAALAILAVGPVLRVGAFVTAQDIFHSGDWAWLFPIRFPYTVNRAYLPPVRLVHFFALIYVGMRLLPRDSHIWKHALIRPFIHCGQHSLAVFSTSVVLSYALDLTYEATHGRSRHLVLLLVAGMALLLLAGNVLAARKRRQRQTVALRDEAPAPALAELAIR